MANWCANQLYFTGNEVAVKEAKELFIQMMNKETETNEGQKPDFIKEVEEGYFFDTLAFTDDDQISFSTRWSPNIKDVVKIAENWQGLDFELNYQEPGSQIYGKAIYKDGTLFVYNLSDSLYEEIIYDDENNIYNLRGVENECEEEFLEQLFKEEFNLDY